MARARSIGLRGLMARANSSGLRGLMARARSSGLRGLMARARSIGLRGLMATAINVRGFFISCSLHFLPCSLFSAGLLHYFVLTSLLTMFTLLCRPSPVFSLILDIHVQVFGRTPVHEFQIFCGHVERNWLFLP